MNVNIESLKAARLKHIQLEREISAAVDAPDRESLLQALANLRHTQSKLGLFMHDAVGDVAWRESAPVRRK